MKNKLSFEELIEGIHDLSFVKGYYGRLYEEINELDELQLDILKQSWDYAFNDIIDFIMYIEG